MTRRKDWLPATPENIAWLRSEGYDSIADEYEVLVRRAEELQKRLDAALFQERQIPELKRRAEQAEAALERLKEAAQSVRTGLGLTAYEGTPVSVWSAKHYEKILGAALAPPEEKQPHD